MFRSAQLIKFNTNSLTCTVAIPTYRRPEYLRRAAISVVSQNVSPEYLLLVAREDDLPTRKVIAELISHNRSRTQIVEATVTEPGFLPPIIAATQMASTDVLAFLDDDADAPEDWLGRHLRLYSEEQVGATGGRYINYFDGVLQKYPIAKKVASLSWSGDLIGNMHCDCAFSNPIDVDSLIGGNMSFRLEYLRKCLPDERLRSNVAFYWELDVAQKIKKLGLRVRFDPLCTVNHHSAPREIDGLRTVNYDGVYWHNYNFSLLMREHLSRHGFLVYILKTLLIGNRISPGIAYIIYSLIRNRPLLLKKELIASIRGRISGIFSPI